MTSIHRRLMLWLLLLVSCGAILNTLTIFIALRGELNELFDENMLQLAQAFSEIHQNEIVYKTHDHVHNSSFKGEEEFLIQIWSHEELVYSSKPDVGFPLQGSLGLHSTAFQHEMWHYHRLDKSASEIIQISQPDHVRDDLIWEIYFKQLIPVILQLPIVILLIWYIVKDGFNPVKDVSESIEKRTHNYLELIPIEGVPDEIKSIVESVNQLLNRLKHALVMQRQFTADAAHELRTPMGALRLELDILNKAETREEKRESINNLYKVTERSTHLIQQLLAMAKLEHESELQVEVKLKPLIDSVIEGYKGLALKKSITITNKCADHVIINGDSNALSIMLSNLIGNALNYGRHNGVVNVAVIFEQEKLVLSVEDNGPGIPEKDRARIFDRFYRVLENQKYSPTGSGLGLAIVKSIADQHDARIEVLDGVNSGVRFNIFFTHFLRRS